ncbi:serpin family protein [bacterium]|nr:MAG: serpin family protein [bacterium]
MKKWCLLSVLVTVSLMACKKDSSITETEPIPLKLTAQQTELIAESNAFGINLFKEVAQDEQSNMMLSPLSASVALSMLMNGADGNTRVQIQEMLGYSSSMSLDDINAAYNNLKAQLLSADKTVSLSLANAMFYRNGFDVKQSYISTLKDAYSAEIMALDFTSSNAVTTINNWASDNTNGKIEKVINEISAETVLFLMNALYFKGTWSAEFDKASTSEQPFYLDNETTIQVPTMNSLVNVRLANFDDFTALELPYGRKNFTMIVLIPKNSISTALSALNADVWMNVTQSLSNQHIWSSVNLFFPKFSITYEKKLNDALFHLGMTDAFKPNQADLSGINDVNNLFVSFVKQNTFIETNEEGSEAAAVTTIGIELTSVGGSTPPIVRVDKPFLFAIREQTSNSLLFIGTVNNPLY